MSANLDSLITQLKAGSKIRDDELRIVKRMLHDPHTGNIDKLARILSLSSEPTRDNVALVETYFTLDTEDWVLQGIIISLCHDWNLTERYLDRLMLIARTTNWESHQSAIIWAFSALGDYLSLSTDLAVLKHIFEQIESIEECSGGTMDYSLEGFGDAAWYAIDRWQRGNSAIFPRTKLNRASKAYSEAKQRYIHLTRNSQSATND